MIVRPRTDNRKHPSAALAGPTASLLEAWGRDLAPSPLEERLRDWLAEGAA